jgi:flavorubredoxin
MFTYLKNEQIIFTCDFLGSHYCEPNFYDKDIKNINQYHSAVENYYYAIFHPFIPYVIKGLEIIKNLNIDTVCPSHGPILTKGSQLEYVIKCYSN